MATSPSAKQRSSIVTAVDGGHPVCLWHGSVRSGKTFASTVAWLEHVRSGPPGPLLMVGKTQDTLERNVIHPMMEMLPDRAVDHTRGSNVARILGRMVHLVGANNVQSEHRIRGMTLAGAYVDEASLLPEGFWPMLRTRLSVEGAKLLATTNPDNPNHWLKVDVIDRAFELGLAHWHFTLDDNPGLPASYVAQLKAELTGLFYRRYIDGAWVAAEGAVYDMLDLTGPHRVQPDQLPIITDHLLGIDVGTINPTHAVLLGVGADRRLYVLGEWRWDSRARQRQLTDADQVGRITDWLMSGAVVGGDGDAVHPLRVGVDPVAASFKTQLHVSGWTGVTREPSRYGTVDGIRMVSSLIAAGRLLFVKGAAPELEAEMTGYSWDEGAAQRGKDEPLKAHDHGPDALRYAVVSSRYLWRDWLAGMPDVA